jgi:hypothetical protein
MPGINLLFLQSCSGFFIIHPFRLALVRSSQHCLPDECSGNFAFCETRWDSMDGKFATEKVASVGGVIRGVRVAQ